MSKYYLIPGNNGKNCFGNGTHRNRSGALIECRCDECDYLICCLENECKKCNTVICPRKRVLKFIRRKRIKTVKRIIKEILYFSGDRNLKRALAEKHNRF